MFGRLRNGLGVAVIAGALTFAVPISTAHALDPGILRIVGKVGTIGGIGAASAPEDAAVAAVCSTGVGCAAIAAAVAGVALYETRDTWVPWLKNMFGAGSEDGGAATGDNVYPLTITWMPMNVGNQSRGVSYVEPQAACGSSCGTTYFQTATEVCRSVGGVDITVPLNSLDQTAFIPRATSGNFPVVLACGEAAVAAWGWTLATTGGAGAILVGGSIKYQASQNHIEWSNTVVFGTLTGGLTDGGTRVSNQVSCVNPDGSTFEVTQGVDGLTGGLAPFPTCTGAAGSQAGAHGQCYTTSAGPIGGPMAVQSSTCGTSLDTMKALYPNCVGVGAIACTYVVRVDGIACTVGATGCVNWEATAAADPSRVACDYGLYVVPLANCAALKRLYETGTIAGTVLNTDNNPRTYSTPGPQGQTVDQPDPGPSPSPSPSVSPQPSPNPTQVPGTVASPTGPQTATERDCWPTGWGMFNPGSWVMQPIKCALSWAFVPSQTAVQGMTNGVGTDLSAAGIGPIAAAVGTKFNLIGQGSGCEGPAVTFSAVGIVKPMHPFSACASPMSTLAGITKALSTIAIVAGGSFGALRAVGAGFGFDVSMGRGHGGASE